MRERELSPSTSNSNYHLHTILGTKNGNLNGKGKGNLSNEFSPSPYISHYNNNNNNEKEGKEKEKEKREKMALGRKRNLNEKDSLNTISSQQIAQIIKNYNINIKSFSNSQNSENVSFSAAEMNVNGIDNKNKIENQKNSETFEEINNKISNPKKVKKILSKPKSSKISNSQNSLKEKEREILEPVLKNFISISRDQNGCRFLQSLLSSAPKFVFEALYEKILFYFKLIATNSFGNYLCQKVVEFLNEEELQKVILGIQKKVLEFSLNVHGTRVIQKIVENIKNKNQMQTLCSSTMRGKIGILSKDINGNHVIQKILHKFRFESENFNLFIFDELSAEFFEIATHKHGCCVLQRCIDCCPKFYKEKMAEETIRNLIELVKNAYGNYVVQYLIENSERDFIDSVFKGLRGKLSSLSKQKFSSNVIEKLISLIGEEDRNLAIEEMMKDEKGFRELLNDPYANYVVQKMVFVAGKEKKRKIVYRLKIAAGKMKEDSIGRKVCNKLVKKHFESKIF